MTTLAFTSRNDPYQLLIKAGTLSPASHAAIGIGDSFLHAYEKGVRFEPRTYWLDKLRQRMVAEFEILPDVSIGLREAILQIGKTYDVVGAFKIAALRALQVFGSPLRNLGPDAHNTYTCAHFVMTLDPTGRRIPEWQLLNRATVAPGDLLRVANGPSFRRVI